MAPTMKAIKVTGVGKAELQPVPLPRLRDDYVLVKVKSVALNPTDWKHVHRGDLSAKGCTVGCDYAGVVEEVGPRVTKAWKKGDRIAGFAHGVNRTEVEDGALAGYCVQKGDVALKIPDNIEDAQAATLGIGVITCGQGLYQSLELPLPGKGKAGYPLLVYGGRTATGSGCAIVTTCSPRNFAFVKSLGAKEAFDYNDPECSKKIREYTQDKLSKVFDCISEGASPNISAEAIGSSGGVISYLLPAQHDRKDVEGRGTLGYTYIGEKFDWAGNEVPAKPQDFEFAKKLWKVSAKLLASGQLSVHPPRVGKDGLKGVSDGLEQSKEGRFGGVKLVYNVEETP